MAFSLITVNLSYHHPDGSPQSGKVRFQLANPMANAGAMSRGEKVATVVDGAATIQLLANDDPDTQPAGTAYTVLEQLSGSPARTYRIVVPAAFSPINLGDLAPPEGSPLYAYVTPGQLATAVEAVASDAAAAVDGAITAAGVARSTSVTPTPGPLIIGGPDEGTDTWLQAEGTIDPDLNLALPTDSAMDALAKKGVPAAAGASVVPADGGFQIVGENDEATWLQAAPYISEATGLAPPTKAALDTLAGEGAVILRLGPAPDALPDLALGEVRAYYDPTAGELIADIGVE